MEYDKYMDSSKKSNKKIENDGINSLGEEKP